MSHRELDDMLGTKWRKPHFVTNPALRWSLIVGFLAYLVAAFMTIEVDWGRVYEGLDRGWQFILAFTKPDFVSRAGDIWEGLLESIVMTVAASVVGILISIPIGLGAARQYRTAASLCGLPWHRCDQSRVARDHCRNSSCCDFRLWPLGGVPDTVLCHNRISVKALGRRH